MKPHFTITAEYTANNGENITLFANLRPCWPWTAQRHADKFRALGWQHVQVGWRWW